MGILTDDMKRVVNEQKAGLHRDGLPGWHSQSLAQRNDGGLGRRLLDLRRHQIAGHRSHLRQNPAIEINVVDQLVRKGYRFKGTAEVFADGPVFEKALALRRERGAKNPMRAVVLISVERALPLISPDYDFGLSEDEMRANYCRHFEVLWSAGEDLVMTPE